MCSPPKDCIFISSESEDDSDRPRPRASRENDHLACRGVTVPVPGPGPLSASGSAPSGSRCSLRASPSGHSNTNSMSTGLTLTEGHPQPQAQIKPETMSMIWPVDSGSDSGPANLAFIPSDEDEDLQQALRLSLLDYHHKCQNIDEDSDMMVDCLARAPTTTTTTSHVGPPRKKMRLQHSRPPEASTSWRDQRESHVSRKEARGLFADFPTPMTSMSSGRNTTPLKKRLRLRDRNRRESELADTSVIVLSDSEDLPDIEVIDLRGECSHGTSIKMEPVDISIVKEEPLDHVHVDVTEIEGKCEENNVVKQEPIDSKPRHQSHNDSGFAESRVPVINPGILLGRLKSIFDKVPRRASRSVSRDSALDAPETSSPASRVASTRSSTDRHFTDAMSDLELTSCEEASEVASEVEHGMFESEVDEPTVEEDPHITQPSRMRRVRGRSRNSTSHDTIDASPVGYTRGRTIVRRASYRHVALFTAGSVPGMVFMPPQLPTEACLVRPFTNNMVNMVEDVLDEGNELLSQAVDVLNDFTTATREPPTELVQRLQTELAKSCNVHHCHRLYNTLLHLLQLHPPCSKLPFSWHDVEALVEGMRLATRALGQEEATHMLSQQLMLDYMVSSIEAELLQHSLSSQRQILKSLAYKWLSAEVSFNNVATVAVWLRNAVLHSEHEDFESSPTQGHMFLQTPPSQVYHAPKVLPLLDRLLDLSICVSRNPEDCARRIAKEIAWEYIHLPTLCQRRRLVSSLSSPLLRCQATQRILENHCGSLEPGPSGSSVTLFDLVDCYFQYSPPCQNMLTPPSTPGSEEGGIPPGGSTRYTTEGCEELCMLLWTLVESHLQVSRGKLSSSIIHRTLNRQPRDGDISKDDLRTLNEMPARVEGLVERLTLHCNDLSPRTYLYITQLQTLVCLHHIT